MNKPLTTIECDSANIMYKKLLQARALIQLLLNATEIADETISNELVSNSIWLVDDLLKETSDELNKRKYLKG